VAIDGGCRGRAARGRACCRLVLPSQGQSGGSPCFMCSGRADRACRAPVARMAPSWSPGFSGPSDRDRRDATARRISFCSRFALRASAVTRPASMVACRVIACRAHPLPPPGRPRRRGAHPQLRTTTRNPSRPLAATNIHGETVALDRVAACSIQDSLASTDRLLSRFQCRPSISLDAP
jgi:hypothetical protein